MNSSQAHITISQLQMLKQGLVMTQYHSIINHAPVGPAYEIIDRDPDRARKQEGPPSPGLTHHRHGPETPEGFRHSSSADGSHPKIS